MWYAQTDYPDIPVDNRSLVIAFANLLQRFNGEIEPRTLNSMLTQDDPQMDLWSVAEYIDDIETDELILTDGAGWPEKTNNAIVEFRRTDLASAGPVSHYCLVADQRAHSIIDSLDGKIKSASIYGTPLSWASYIEVSEEVVVPDAEPPKPGSTYKVLSGGESVWEISRKLHFSATDLIDHNELEDLNQIPEGTILHLPIALPQKEERRIRYEIFPEDPVPMHVVKEDGARKWSFGNARKWEDVVPSGPTYAPNTNISIVAIAEVPIGDETAAYYLDAVALGNYAQTGRVQYTVGFNHSHLAEGEAERRVIPPKPEIQVKLDEAEKILAEVIPEVELPLIPEDQPEDHWKDTFYNFNEDMEPVIYIAAEATTVHDYDGERPDRTLERGKGVKIVGPFWKDGVELGRPFGVTNWYGIPMKDLMLEDDDELYNYDVPLAERATLPGGHLTATERYWLVPFAKVVSQYALFKSRFNKNK